MITNPTQRQLDTRHKLDTVIVLNKSKTQRFIEHILDKLTGNVPNYVMYNNKQYESNELIIYTKEEVASMYSTKIKCTIGNRASRYRTPANLEVSGNINNILLETPDGTRIHFDYNELYQILLHIENLYDVAVENPKQFEYNAAELYKLQDFNYRLDENTMEKFTFINNLYLDISIIQNINTHKYTANERFLNIELSKEFDTIEETKEYLNDVIATRLHLLLEDKKSADKVLEYKIIELKNKDT